MAELTTEQTEQRRQIRSRAAMLSLLVSVLLLLVKFLAYLQTGSAAVLSDALESIVNVVSASFLVLSVRLAAKPADADHPYGHGKVEDFAAGAEGAMIVLAAAAIAWSAIPRFANPTELEALGSGSLLVGGAAFVNLLVGLLLVRTGKRHHSRALEADGRHLLTDVVTSIGAIVALLAVRLTGALWIDPLIALLLAAHIVGSGVTLIRDSVRRLMDEADEGLLDQLSEALNSARREPWIDVHHLRAWRAGDLLHVDLHLTVPRYFTVQQAHVEDERVASTVQSVSEIHASTIVHLDPCRPRDCGGCIVEGCDLRERETGSNKEWTRRRLTAGPMS